MRGMFEPWHIVVLVVVIAVLFGGKRLPDAARGLGRSMRIFKAEVKQMQDDSAEPPAKAQTVNNDAVEGKIVGAPSQTQSQPGLGEQPKNV